MKILLSFSILSFGVFIPPVGCDQSITNPMPLLMTNCRIKFEKLYLERYNASTIFVKANDSTKKNNPARSKEHYADFNFWEACIKLSGQCKNQCGEKEFRMAYCARPTTPCCMRQCDNNE